MRSELEVYKELFEDGFFFHPNLNDTFAYACADTEQLRCGDIQELIPLMQEYPSWMVLAALASIARGRGEYAAEKPIKMDEEMKSTWDKVVAEVLKLARSGTVLFEEYYERNGKHPLTKLEQINQLAHAAKYCRDAAKRGEQYALQHEQKIEKLKEQLK